MEKERKADKYYDTFPTKLRNLLKARNITHTSLASHLNISRQSISQYCDGSTQPNIETIVKIAEVFQGYYYRQARRNAEENFHNGA